jgi:tryptophan synthase beta chain
LSSILGAILEAKEKRIAEGRLDFPLVPQPRGNGAAFREALERRPAVIAEIKHRSPSAGEILPRAEERIEEIARAYRRGGAAALSVVIEHDFFGGNPDFLPRAKAASGLPALMKDFVVSETQLNLAVALGADAVLLIASALDDMALARLHRAAEARGLAVLVEAHDEEEIGRAAAAGARIVGINARDLRTFRVDLERMAQLGALLPADVVRVAESGIKTNADLERLDGFDAYLVGESLLRDADPCAGLRRLRGESTVHVKICGLTRAADVDACVREGVDELGFNFSPRSPRRVTLEAARALAARSGGLGVVAVFSGNGKAEIEEIAAALRPCAVSSPRSRQKVSRFPRAPSSGERFAWGKTTRRGRDLGVRPPPLRLRARRDIGRHGKDLRLESDIGFCPGAPLRRGRGPRPRERRRRDSNGATVRRRRGVGCRERSRRKGRRADRGVREDRARVTGIPALGRDTLGERMTTGYFGEFGGRFVPETLMAPLDELWAAYQVARATVRSARSSALPSRRTQAAYALTFARSSPRSWERAHLPEARGPPPHRCAQDQQRAGAGPAREAPRQVPVIAETGAGQHGVATATACALLGLECVVYMGEVDMARQALNVFRMKTMGATVIAVRNGSRTLKDAINEALRDWVASFATTHYILGSVLGPHPFPEMVRDFQAVIGKEALEQVKKAEGRLPDTLVACVGGGSNAIGLFHAFVPHASVEMVGVEAGGRSLEPGEHAARFGPGTAGVLHGTRTLLLQDENGQILPTHSVSAGLDYPAVGPEHAYLASIGRSRYVSVTDVAALAAFHRLARTEGILPALETAHAVAWALEEAPKKPKDHVMVVNLSGRGDKDVHTVAALSGVTL